MTPEDAEVDVGATERGLQHGETNADALQFKGVSLLLRYIDRQNATA